MASTNPIGELLTEAGLISPGQLQTALYDQQVYTEMRLGEILALRGWLQQQTVDFFSDFFQHSSPETMHFRLGDCFKQAALISPEQVDNIVKEQKLNHVRFGSIAVLKGYISQKTLDFFLEHLDLEQSKSSGFWQGNLRRAKAKTAEKVTVPQHDRKTFFQKETASHQETIIKGVATLEKEDHNTPYPASIDDVDIHWI